MLVLSIIVPSRVEFPNIEHMATSAPAGGILFTRVTLQISYHARRRTRRLSFLPEHSKQDEAQIRLRVFFCLTMRLLHMTRRDTRITETIMLVVTDRPVDNHVLYTLCKTVIDSR
jgi:hypothetical protein